jgi:hypothetical protein
MFRLIFLLISVFAILLLSCSHDRMDLPTIPAAEEQFQSIDDAEYVQINPPLDAAHGYSFNHPADIYLGVDNFLYVADTDNNRIVMMDIGGQEQGVSQFIAHPEAISQNDSLQLLVVNKTNAVFKIDLFKHNHQIGAAPVDTVFVEESEPNRQFTGISVFNKFEYYVTVIDVGDSSTNFKEFNFIYDFTAKNKLKGPLPLYVNGTGLFSALIPTSIVSLRERWVDISSNNEVTPAFMFTQRGKTSLLSNNFKVQHVTTALFEGDEQITPNTAYIGTDLYSLPEINNPEDIALDRGGFIFVVNAGSRNGQSPPGFYRFSSTSGNLLQKVEGFGSGEAQFNYPKGIAVLPFLEDQIVYIADTYNNRILLFKLSTDF